MTTTSAKHTTPGPSDDHAPPVTSGETPEPAETQSAPETDDTAWAAATEPAPPAEPPPPPKWPPADEAILAANPGLAERLRKPVCGDAKLAPWDDLFIPYDAEVEQFRPENDVPWLDTFAKYDTAWHRKWAEPGDPAEDVTLADVTA